jgi:hypothetical protein
MRRALLLCAFAGVGVAQAASPPPDAELLEFLGSVGAEDDWQEYLEEQPVKDAGKKEVKSVPPPVAKTPAKPDEKQVKAK